MEEETARIDLLQDYATAMLDKLHKEKRGPPPGALTESRPENPAQNQVQDEPCRKEGPRIQEELPETNRSELSRSPLYSRTCPVRIGYRNSGKEIIGLAIVDDQCTMTTVDE